MIYNRTIADVRRAVQLRKSKVEKGRELTDAEKQLMERGFFTINTANRIESKQAELNRLFEEMGYYGANVETKEWNLGDVFLQQDLARLCENASKLKRAFFVYATTPYDAMPKFFFWETNLLEKILYDLEKMQEFVATNYQECGAVECGG